MTPATETPAEIETRVWSAIQADDMLVAKVARLVGLMPAGMVREAFATEIRGLLTIGYLLGQVNAATELANRMQKLKPQ